MVAPGVLFGAWNGFGAGGRRMGAREPVRWPPAVEPAVNLPIPDTNNGAPIRGPTMASSSPTGAGPARAAAATKAPLDVAPPPILARVDALVRAGRDADAIVLAYQSAEADVLRAFGLKLPKQWTHRELLERHLRSDMGYLTALLPRLYALFEPVRYGRPQAVSSAGLMDLLRKIYEEPALRRLSWTIGADSTLTSRAAPARGAPARPGGAGSSP
jgi:hypothetical protein